MSEKIGIIITVENYQASPFGLNKVDYATNDGIEIKKVFSEVLKIDKNNIYCYQDEQFTRSTAMEEIQYYLTQMPIETELYLYYAGHGFFSEGKNYLTTYDTSKLDLVRTSLSFEELFFDTFRKSRAKACIAFIDACAESTSSNERGLSIRGLDFRNTTMCDESEFRYALYFSCSPYEKSISDDTLQHGIWTSCLLDALTGDESAYVKQQLQCKDGEYFFCSPKSGKGRTITPAPIVMDALQQEWRNQHFASAEAGDAWDNPYDLVFTDALGKHLVRRTVVKHFKAVVQRVGIPEARFHDLRHSFAVSSLQAGDDIKTVQANLGHATAAFTLDVYGHVTEKMKRDSATRMQRFYESIRETNSSQ